MGKEVSRQKMMVAIYYDESSQRVLLGMKKSGFGEGRWNGYGGKVKPGETIEQATRRELQEEAGILPGDLETRGVIDFEFWNKPGEILEVHFLRILNYFGEPRETDEMRPGWFGVNEIPYDKMWPDDRYWVPLFLQGRRFGGKILFGKGDSILENGIIEVSSL